VLAGERYAPGLVVIPWFAAAFVMLGSVCIAASGIYIDKRPRALAKWVAVAFVLNVSLNLLTVPKWGLVAAAVVTFFSMTVQCLGVYWEAHKTLPVKPPIRVVASSLIAALVALQSSRLIDTGHVFSDLIACGLCALFVYVGVLFTLNAPIRREATAQIRGFLAKP